MKETVSVAEASRRLGISEETCREVIARGLIPNAIRFKKETSSKYQYIIPRQKFEEWLGNRKATM